MYHPLLMEEQIITQHPSSFIKIKPDEMVGLPDLKVPVSIYKTVDSYEVMVFAPRRIKENFLVKVSGEELIIAYQPAEDVAYLDWNYWQMNHGGFERTFLLDHAIDESTMHWNYEGGMLRLVLFVL